MESRRVMSESPVHIEIPNDTLIPDEEFCRVVLGGCTRRTASRYEAEGLPVVMVAAPDGFVTHSFAGDDPIACRDYVRQKLGLPEYLQVHRLADKSGFPQYHWDGEKWISGRPKGAKIPYMLPQLIAAATVLEEATAARPQMPAGVEDRNADCWEALLAVADIAGGTWGGQYRSVIIDEFIYRVRRLTVWVDYAIVCTVVQNPMNGVASFGAGGGVGGLITTDLARAGGL
jgi:hypothetical protein